MISLTTAAPAVGAAFVASLVEVVAAVTIVLAAGTLRGWRGAIAGTAAGLALLALMVVALGPLLEQVPLHSLQLAIGVLLLLFGMGWLRKAVLRVAGVTPLHDEDAAFAAHTASLSGGTAPRRVGLDWLGAIMTFKAVVLEGLEVVFIVIAVGAGRGLLLPASLGALAACIVVLAIGVIVRRPLARASSGSGCPSPPARSIRRRGWRLRSRSTSPMPATTTRSTRRFRSAPTEGRAKGYNLPA